MSTTLSNTIKALSLVAAGLAIGATGVYVGDTHDAPGAALIGLLIMVAAIGFAVRILRRKT